MIVNLQRKVKLDAKAFGPFVSVVAGSVDECGGGTFSVAFVSDRRMRELNKFFRGKDATTDVLSFPHEPDEFEPLANSDPNNSDHQIPAAGHRTEAAVFLGDIVISAEQAARQAAGSGLSLETEIKQLILHGLLHLCGYDHETDSGEMNARELELRRRLGIDE